MPQNKMGRPPSENPKSDTIRVRADLDTIKKLEECVQALQSERSEIVRKGIDIVHKSLKK